MKIDFLMLACQENIQFCRVPRGLVEEIPDDIISGWRENMTEKPTMKPSKKMAIL